MNESQRGVAIVVWRRSRTVEVLLLHRSVFGADFEGDWAWTTPGGERRTGERPRDAAERELSEETGLALALEPTTSEIAPAGEHHLAVYVAEAPHDAEVRLSDEHDRFEWVRREELSRCLPAWVGAMYANVLDGLDPM